MTYEGSTFVLYVYMPATQRRIPQEVNPQVHRNNTKPPEPLSSFPVTPSCAAVNKAVSKCSSVDMK